MVKTFFCDDARQRLHRSSAIPIPSLSDPIPQASMQEDNQQQAFESTIETSSQVQASSIHNACPCKQDVQTQDIASKRRKKTCHSHSWSQHPRTEASMRGPTATPVRTAKLEPKRCMNAQHRDEPSKHARTEHTTMHAQPQAQTHKRRPTSQTTRQININIIFFKHKRRTLNRRGSSKTRAGAPKRGVNAA